MNMLTRILFRSLFFLVIVLITMALVVTWYKGYLGSIESILSIVNTRKSSSELSALITEQRFRYIQFLLLVMIFLLGGLMFKFNALYRIFSQQVSNLYQFTKSLFNTTLLSENKFLMLIPVAGIFYYAIKMPVCYDEGLTYLYFTSKGILSSLSFYPEPNNHILHSLFTNFTIHLPIGDTEFRLRLPSLLTSVITWMLSYKLLLKYYNNQVAMLVTAIGSMIFLVFYYSYQSRGYALVVLFFIAALYNALGIIRKTDNKENWTWFGMSCILGFYTMPSFLYPFLTLNFIILLYNRPHLKRQFITNAVITAITVFLYVPIIIVNGLDALTNNPWVRSIDRNQVIKMLPGFLKTSLDELTQLPWWLVLLILLPSFIYAVLSRQKFILSLFIIFMLAPAVLLLTQSVIPFPRTFIYYGFMLPLLAVISFADQLKKIPVIVLTIGLMIMQLGMLYLFNARIYAYEERDPQLNMTSKKLTNMMVGNKRYYSSGNLLGTTLQYELKVQGFTNSTVVFGKGPVSADSLTNFDYIIIGLENDQTKIKKPRISTVWYHIY
jgi:predicted secreted protein